MHLLLRRESAPHSASSTDQRVRGSRHALHPTETIFAPVLIALILGVVGYLPDLLSPTSRTWIELALSIVAMVVTIAFRRPAIRWTLSATFITVFYLTSTFTVARYGALSDLVGSVAALLLTMLLALLAGSFTGRETNALTNGILVVCSFQFMFAIGETFFKIKAPRGYSGQTGSTFGVNPLLTGFGRAPGTLTHGIPLGTYMACAVLLIIFAKRDWPVFARLLGSLLFTFGLLLSGTRSALFFGIAAALVSLCLSANSRHVWSWRWITLVSAAIFLLGSGLSQLTEAAGLDNTGSLTHRIAAFDAAGRLFERSVPEILFGSGTGSIKPLFDLGLLQSDGFEVVDNEFVSVFAVGGLLGILAVVGLIVIGLRQGAPGLRPAMVFLLLMFFSFDVFARLSTLVLFIAIVSTGTDGRWKNVYRPDAGANAIEMVPSTSVHE